MVPGDEGRARRRAKRRLPPLGRKPMPNPRFVRFAQQLPGYRLGRWCYRRIRPLTLEEWRYNAETVAVMERVLRADSIGLDIGAHAGSSLRDLVRLAPRGSHWAFEPLPFAAGLRTDFPLVEVCEVALSAVAPPGVERAPVAGHLAARGHQMGGLDRADRAPRPPGSGRDTRGIRQDRRRGRRARRAARRRAALAAASADHRLRARPGISRHLWHQAGGCLGLLTGFGLQVTTMARWLRDGPRSPGVPSCFTSNAAGQSTSSLPRGNWSFEGVLDAKAGRHWPDTRGTTFGPARRSVPRGGRPPTRSPP